MPPKKNRKLPRPLTQQQAEAQARRNKRQRRKKRAANSMEARQPVRTEASIVQTLAKSFSRMKMRGLKPYAHCRLMSIAPEEIPSIPDGANGRHICLCLFKSNRITWSGTGSKSASFQINPWIPAPCLATGDSTLLIDGVSTVTTAGLWAPFGVPDEMATGVGNTTPGNTQIDPYYATQCRIIAIIVEIIYTGPVNTCAGLIRVTPNNMVVSDSTEVTNTSASLTAPTSGIALGNFSVAGSLTSWSPINTSVVSWEGAPVATGMVRPNSKQFRPEEGAVVRLKHRTADFKSIPLRDNSIGVVARGTTSAAGAPTLLGNQIGQIPGYGGGLRAYDNDWEGQIVNIENVNADASYVVNTCVCIEATPSQTSPFYPLAKEAVKADPAQIKQVNAALEKASVLPQRHRD